MPELKQLKILLAVARAGSFSSAADALAYTQPAVSKILAGLEREVGTTLIDRGTRPLRLTDAGEALAHRAEAALAQIAAAEEELHAIGRLGGGRLRIATFASAGSGFVVGALRKFRRAHPHVDVTLSEIGMPSALARGLRACDFDLGVTFDYPETGEDLGADLDLHPLLDDPFDLVVPRGHPLAERERVRFADLIDEDWLMPDFGRDSPSFRMIDRRCADAGFEPRVVLHINDCQMTQALVAAGEGIALLPRLMLHPLRPGVRIKPLAKAAPIRRISALRLPTRYRAPATERFIELLTAEAARHAAD
jgi:DNA-binding transcriptional LysR family regulator